MLKIFRGLVLVLVGLVGSAYVTPTYASSASVLITAVQFGDSDSALNEYVTIYNNSDSDIDISDWCLANKSLERFVCFGYGGDNFSLILPARTQASVVSESTDDLTKDYAMRVFSPIHSTRGSITGSSDTIYLVNASGQVVDVASWSSSATGKYTWQRSVVDGEYVDTGTETDWSQTPVDSDYATINGSYVRLNLDETELVDVCADIDGHQIVPPREYVYDQTIGDCSLWIDTEIDPENVLVDQSEDVGDDDSNGDIGGGDAGENETGDGESEADHIDGSETVDSGTELQEIPVMTDFTPSIYLSELLPNVTGSDNGQEFIEIYNPTDATVYLDEYVLRMGKSLEKQYDMHGLWIESNSYLAIYNTEISYSMLNTTNTVALQYGDYIFDETTYSSPKEDEAWSLIDGTWQYTDNPTPGAANLPSTDDTASSTDDPTGSILKPCAEGYYRNPETNRCKKITSTENTLVPCKEGYERNPETNRCRKIVEMTDVDYDVMGAVETSDGSSGWYIWLAVGSFGLFAGGYSLWEWRREIYDFLIKLRKKLY